MRSHGIRQRTKKKQQLLLYREQERSEACKQADADLQAEITIKKEAFVDDVLRAPPRNYYDEAAKQLLGPNPKKARSVLQLLLEQSPELQDP